MKKWCFLFLTFLAFSVLRLEAADVVVYKGTFRNSGSLEESPNLPRSGSIYFVIDYTTGHSWLIYYFNRNGRRYAGAVAEWNITTAPLADGRFASVLALAESRNTSLTDFNHTFAFLTGTNLPFKIQDSPALRTVNRPRSLTGSYTLAGGPAGGNGIFKSIRYVLAAQSELTKASNNAGKSVDTVAAEIASKLETQGYAP